MSGLLPSPYIEAITRAENVERKCDALLGACRSAIMALAHASESHPEYERDYEMLSDAITQAINP